MKRLKTFATLLLCCVPALTVIADSGRDKPPTTEKVVLLKYKSPHGRPNAPAREFIECQYGAGYMEFVFPNNALSLTVQIYNTTDSWIGFVTVEEPVIDTPVFNGEYTIQCTSDDGRIFSGIIEF